MSDTSKENTPPKPQQPEPIIKPALIKKLPPQSSPTDTSNWDDRTFTTPSGRLVIETEQPKKGDINVAE
jgi:hypothetical protein